MLYIGRGQGELEALKNKSGSARYIDFMATLGDVRNDVPSLSYCYCSPMRTHSWCD